MHVNPQAQVRLGAAGGELIDQGIVQLVGQACAPPFGFKDRQAAIALADHYLRAINLRRYADPLQLYIDRAGKCGLLRRQGVVVDRIAATSCQQQGQAQQCEFCGVRHSRCSCGQLRDEGLRLSAGASLGLPRSNDSGLRPR
ncbi:hypothetical protein D3C75_998510 [compost metagenome]